MSSSKQNLLRMLPSVERLLQDAELKHLAIDVPRKIIVDAARAGIESFSTPGFRHDGPKVMLINGWSGSGGDAFPDYFKKRELGPLIGTRTWGGLIGYTGVPNLIDGGRVTVPTFRMYDPDGKWFKEGHGVDPDIEVMDDPTEMANGKDPQLEAAISETLKLIKENPPVKPNQPAYEKR